MRILGIDPGLRITGFGVVDKLNSNTMRYVASGTIKTKTVSQGDLPNRIKIIVDGINELQQRYQANTAAIEIVFVNVNPQATLLLGQARGAALAALTQSGLTVNEYTALQVKKAITGNGRASKQQIQLMVSKLLNLTTLPSPDAADALAIAITHAHVSNIAGHRSLADKLQRKTSALYKKSRYY